MSDLLQRAESSSIGADLRTRMEGGVELLEDGLHLVESVVTALNRPDFGPDDLDTLREAVSQLPRLDEICEALQPHEEATPLTRVYVERKRWAIDALTLKLGAEPPSVRDGLQRVLQRALRDARAPREGETRLLEDPGGHSVLPWLFGVMATIVGGLSGAFGVGLLIGLLGFFGLRRLLPPRPAWTLLPDRLHVVPRGPPFDLLPATVRTTRQRSRLRLDAAGQTLVVDSELAPALEVLLALLGTAWLSNLEPRPEPHALVSAIDLDTDARGTAWVSAEGLLFIPGTGEAVCAAICPNLPGPPPELSRLALLLAHVPAGRMNGLGEELARKTASRWLPKGTLSVVPSANELLGAEVRPRREGPGRLRLTFDFQRSAETRALLKSLQAT